MLLRTLLLLITLLSTAQLHAQAYAHVTYTQHFSSTPTTNAIMQRFNNSANHSLEPIQNLGGYQFGFGSYGWYTLMELNYGNLVRSQQSRNPNQIRENAEVVINQSTINLNLGIRPIANRYFVVGAGIHLGQTRIRYAFGGDYIEAVKPYVMSAQLFMGYGFKTQFLLKKERRPDYYYVFRIRAYYQAQQVVDVSPLEQQLNGGPINPADDFDDNLSGPGIQVSLIAPFMKGGKVVERGGSGAREQSKRRRKIRRARRQRKRELRNLDWDSPASTEETDDR